MALGEFGSFSSPSIDRESDLIRRADEDIMEIAKREKEISELKQLIRQMYDEAFEELHPDTIKLAKTLAGA